MPPKFFFISILYSLIFTQYSYSQCLDNQKSLLLQLKNELIFNSSMSIKLVQWNQSNECCKWYGVECDAAGHVISLHLDDEYISGGIGESSTLFRFKYLEKLNLADNDFNYTQIPRGIHNLTYLTHLNLSYASFSGQIPAEISSLRRLISLDISNYYTWPPWFEKPNLETFLQNLTGLRELYLDRVYIASNDERRKWSHIISSYLPNLTALSLIYCDLSGPLAKSFWQLRSLSILRLDDNDLSTVAPDLFASFSSLTALRLSSCRLNGSFHEMLFQIPTLQYLDLSNNDLLSGSIPFANLTQLIYVDLSSNMFTGPLSSTMFEGLSNLAYLDLSHNSFYGNIPRSLFGLPSLLKLQLNDNQFSGQVEEFFTVNISNIVSLNLGNNRLEGPIPDSFFKLQSLQTLSLFGNLFNGTFQLEKIRSLVNLTVLSLSYNNLSVDSGNDSSSSYGFPQLDILDLASCNMYSFPQFIKHCDIIILDLSDNRIGGEIPSWIWGTKLQSLDLSLNLLTHVQKPHHLPLSLESLDLHSNQLRGELHMLIPHNLSTPRHFFLSLANNSLCGSIPTFLCNATNFRALDLSLNKLSGTIPSCLLDGTLKILLVLNLGRNNISGHIPDNFTPSCMMEYFDVNNNTIQGKIPKSIERCKWLEFMNVGNNIIDDTFPCMPSLKSLRVLDLHSNRFHGEVKCSNDSWPELQIIDISWNNFSGSLDSINFSSWRAMALNNDAKRRHNHSDSDLLMGYGSSAVGVRIIMKGQEVEIVKIWPDFTVIDFSCNKFQGKIPNAIGDLNSLHLLNLSHNALNGSIPKSFGKMGDLESLDLSQNQLAGHIPEELGRLTFLSFLNLSYNKFAGVIPKGSQFQTFSADSFQGNSGLCGFPLNLSCTPARENENVHSEREIEWEYVCAALGYVVGLGIIVWLLLFCRSFRQKYFGKIDEVVEEMFDARDRRQRRRRLARREVMIRNRVRRR